MKRILLTLAVLVAGSVTLHAQAVVTPAAPLDAARTRVRDALLVLRDSLMTVNGAAARLQRDFRKASPALLSARARDVSSACARSARTIPATRQVVAAAQATNPVPVRSRTELVRSLDSLAGVMTRCSTEFGAMAQAGKAEEVRGYGNRRAEPILKTLEDYDFTAESFFATWGIEVRPLGARPNPLAGG
jgi:hypothetical protein